MRKPLLAGAALIAAAATLAACGASSVVATLRQNVASVGASQFVQVHLAASVTGPGTEQHAAVLRALSIEVRAENPSGGAVSAANGTNDVEFLVNDGSTTVLDARQVAGNLYLRLDASTLGGVPGLGLTATEATALQLLFGDRWFELPASFLDGLLAKAQVHEPTPQQQAGARAAESKVLDALARLLATTPYHRTSSGYSEHGTLRSLERALLPAVGAMADVVAGSIGARATGTYSVSLGTSGSRMTGLSLSVTGPGDAGGAVTATVSATVTHDALAISAPSGATVVTRQLLDELSLRALH